MTDLVDPDRIEELVGARRHATEHYGRAVSTSRTVYVLHSEACRASTPDLRDCPFSRALDDGIELPTVWEKWEHVQDRPVVLDVAVGFLIPDPTRFPLDNPIGYGTV